MGVYQTTSLTGGSQVAVWKTLLDFSSYGGMRSIKDRKSISVDATSGGPTTENPFGPFEVGRQYVKTKLTSLWPPSLDRRIHSGSNAGLLSHPDQPRALSSSRTARVNTGASR
jgi:hypothetical protein